jgi:hypothetical protein
MTCEMLNKIATAQVSDTTEYDSSNADDFIKIYFSVNFPSLHLPLVIGWRLRRHEKGNPV